MTSSRFKTLHLMMVAAGAALLASAFWHPGIYAWLLQDPIGVCVEACERHLRAGATAAGCTLIVLGLVLPFGWGRLRPLWDGVFDAYGSAVDAWTAREKTLFVVSALSLFIEIFLIRWISTEIRVMAYFKNGVLLASYLGLGIGFAWRDGRRLWFPLFTPAFALFSLIIYLGSRPLLWNAIRFPAGGLGYHHFTYPGAMLSHAIVFGIVVGVLLLSVILLLIPIGQLAGRLMRGMPPLRAYSINVAGSLAGILLFTALSYWRTSPAVWLAVAGIMCLPLAWKARWTRVAVLVSMGLLLGTMNLLGVVGIWSPYQKLTRDPKVIASNDGSPPLDAGFTLSVNQAYFQYGLNLSRDFVSACGGRYPEINDFARVYDFPYQGIPRVGDVLILGSGVGNDVAAALRAGADSVEAVEIDPVIIETGQRDHPEHPYGSPKVRGVNADARSYLSHCDRKFDLIVFALLDSHTLLATMGGVRLDDYVYTLESFRTAAGLLREGGRMSVSFHTLPWMRERISSTLEMVFGYPPQQVMNGVWDMPVFVTEKHAAHPAVRTERWATVATDNWPFFYLEKPGIPQVYVYLIAIFLAVSLGTLSGFMSLRNFQPHFFWLGAGFMLLETRGVTHMALMLGTTWVVNSVVIASVLLVILAANVWCARRQPGSSAGPYLLLAAGLAAIWLIPWGWVLTLSLPLRACIAGASFALPVLAAGVIFARNVLAARSLSDVLASNMLGCAVGGLLEYSSLILGMRALIPMAAAIYALSWICLRQRI